MELEGSMINASHNPDWSFNKLSMSIYCVPGSVLVARDREIGNTVTALKDPQFAWETRTKRTNLENREV